MDLLISEINQCDKRISLLIADQVGLHEREPLSVLLVRDFFHSLISSLDLLLKQTNKQKYYIVLLEQQDQVKHPNNIIPCVDLTSTLDRSWSQQATVTCLTHGQALRPLNVCVWYYGIMNWERRCLYFFHIKWHREVIYTLFWEKKGVSSFCCYKNRKKGGSWGLHEKCECLPPDSSLPKDGVIVVMSFESPSSIRSPSFLTAVWSSRSKRFTYVILCYQWIQSPINNSYIYKNRTLL